MKREELEKFIDSISNNRNEITTSYGHYISPFGLIKMTPDFVLEMYIFGFGNYIKSCFNKPEKLHFIRNNEVKEIVQYLVSKEINDIKHGLSLFFNDFSNVIVSAPDGIKHFNFIYNKEADFILQCGITKFYAFDFYIIYKNITIEAFSIKDSIFTKLYQELILDMSIEKTKSFINAIISYEKENEFRDVSTLAKMIASDLKNDK